MKRWGAVAAGLVLVCLVGAWVALSGKTVPGVAVPNPQAVTEAAQERKVEADKIAAEQKRQQEARELQQLETEVRDGMQGYFDEPDNAMGDRFVVSKVTLFKTGDTTFEGLATMAVNGRPAKDIEIHVTADDRNLMWKTDPGALLPLFR